MSTRAAAKWFLCLLNLVMLTPALARGQASVLTNHYDDARTGANLSETTLTVANVDVNRFGKLYSYPVDGAVVAQPLYVSGVVIGGTRHNVLYVATMNDKVYAFDADTSSPPLWTRDFTSPPSTTYVPLSDVPAEIPSGGDLPNLGVQGTPVIDAGTGTMYLVALTKESGTYVQRLHALDITTGADRAGSPVAIQASVQGTALDAVGGVITFDPLMENQRAGLALTNGVVLIAWASHDDITPYHGWVMAYDALSLSQVGVFCTTLDYYFGGIWQSGRAPAIDSAGNAYYQTGNAVWDGVRNFGDSILKFAVSRTGLSLVDWFTPSTYDYLNINDIDLGSTGATILPGTNVLVGGGKDSILYLTRLNNLGHETANDVQILQKLSVNGGSFMSGPAYWKSAAAGPLLFNWAENDVLHAYHFNGATLDTAPYALGSQLSPGHPGGALAISANGDISGTGIVWASIPTSQSADLGHVAGILRAYNAETLQEIWDSEQNPTRDRLGAFLKFLPPVVVNGKVFMASYDNAVAVYGLLPASDFSLSASPSSMSLAQGAQGIATITVTPAAGFTTTVDLTVTSGCPIAAACTLSPASVAGGSGTSNLTITAASTTPAGVYSIVISGNGGLQTTTVSLTVVSSGTSGPACPCSIWSNAAAPAVVETSDTNSVELGLRFTADVSGVITGLRFYKGMTAAGPHVGNLWTSSGTLLATATFTNETASGWQEVALTPPVAIVANTTYVASYHAPAGTYAVDNQYFAAGVDNAPLHALADAVTGRNGLFLYGSGGFPTNSYQASNYWVDVVFLPDAGIKTTVPNVVGVTQAAATSALAGAGLTTGTVSAAASATVGAGLVISQMPAAGTSAAAGSPVSFVVSTGPAAVSVPDVVTLTQAAATSAITGAGLVAGTVTTASSPTVPAGTVISQSPTAGTLVAPASAVSLVVSSGQPVSGCPCSLWSAAAMPTAIETGDTNAVELGMRFTADVSGTITGVRFYKGALSSSPHVANLWTNTGALLATATFINETASGWQEVSFSIPVAITANTPYVVSYHTPNGNYAVDNNYFTAGVDAAPLHALADGGAGSNGVYQYGASSFPTSTWASSNYWVDVVFMPSASVTVPSVVNLTQTAATAAITSAGLVVGTVTTAATATVPAGAVISQTPPASTQVTAGSAVSFVVSTGPMPTGPAVDTVVFSDGSGAVTTPSFGTSSVGEVLIAFVASDGPASGGQALSVTGAGLTWTLVTRANTQYGTSEIWAATAINQLADVTVSATQTAAGYHQSLTVVAFTGASGIGASSVAGASSGPPQVSLTTTKGGSLIYGVGNDWDSATARVPGANQVMVHQWVDSGTGDTYWVQALSAPVAVPTAVQLGDSSPTTDRWNFASVEILSR